MLRLRPYRGIAQCAALLIGHEGMLRTVVDARFTAGVAVTSHAVLCTDCLYSAAEAAEHHQCNEEYVYAVQHIGCNVSHERKSGCLQSRLAVALAISRVQSYCFFMKPPRSLRLFLTFYFVV